MPWVHSRPRDSWREQDTFSFMREVYARAKFGSFTWNAPSITANTTVDTTLTTTTTPILEGLRVGMAVTVSPPSTLDTGLVVGGAWVATDDTLTIRLGNLTGLAINPASGTWAFTGSII